MMMGEVDEMNAKLAPIGVFDSGVGGISVLSVLREMLPGEDFIYFGDTAHSPYGTKQREEVLHFVDGVVEHLLGEGVKAVVIACNTATSVAAQELRERLTLPIIGMEPALKPAQELRRGGRILVMATPVTLGLPKFRRLMEKYGEGAEPVACAGLMELVEQEDFDGIRTFLLEKLSPYDLDEVDAVVLGCTHYVFARPVLQSILPAHVAILDGNEGTARQLKRVLNERGLLRDDDHTGTLTMQTSGDDERVLPIMQRLLKRAQMERMVK